MNWVYKIVLANLIIVLLLSGCQQEDKKGHSHEGMANMVKDNADTQRLNVNLSSLLKPTNSYVVSSIPTTAIGTTEVTQMINAIGSIGYDTRQAGVISSRIAGRIEKLYVHYRYQKIDKGQKIIDIYSPELLTDQENLLFLLKNDPTNSSLINASKERLQLLGVSTEQIQAIINNNKPVKAITVYSNYSGHIHEAGIERGNNMNNGNKMPVGISMTTEPLSFREGMYVQKGQEIFSVFNSGKAWVLLNIYSDNQQIIKLGSSVHIKSEAQPDREFDGKIDFVEPVYRTGSKTLTARVYFDNSVLQIPIGSQVKAVINNSKQTIPTLPTSAVVSLGIDKIVFRKVNGGFKAHKVEIGNVYDNKIEILNGLSARDSVAINAEYLMDSESFIKVNE